MPQQKDPYNHRIICNIVLLGTYITVTAIFALLLVSYASHPAPYMLGRIAISGLAFLYVVAAHILFKLQFRRTVAFMLTTFYLLLAGGIVWIWGINTPIGTLTFALAIVLAGILLSARHALVAALLATLTLLGIQLSIGLGWYQKASALSSFGDAIAYSVVFGMLALVSWLYNREMARSLNQAWRAEAALQQQKDTLKIQVQKRTAQLRQSQLKEIQQMYRFTELGQLGVTLLHDLANHLTALTLEIDDLQNSGHSKAIARARHITHYLGKIVDNTRDRLNGKTQKKKFNIVRSVSDIVHFLRHRADKANVTIMWQPPAETWQLTGDALSLTQVLAIIICNGIDAYKDSAITDRQVHVAVQRSKHYIIIRISNHGKKMTRNQYNNLFKPFHTTKKSGMGLGLFIAKQTVELQFSGTLAVNPKKSHTEFVITLPRNHGT